MVLKALKRLSPRPYLEFIIHDGPVVRENRDICDLYIEALKGMIPAGSVAAHAE
jgi:hypothetical protein